MGVRVYEASNRHMGEILNSATDNYISEVRQYNTQALVHTMEIGIPIKGRVRLNVKCLLDTKSKGNRRQTREQAVPNEPQYSTDSPESQKQEEGTGREEEEEKGQEGDRKRGQTHHTGYLGCFGSF